MHIMLGEWECDKLLGAEETADGVDGSHGW